MARMAAACPRNFFYAIDHKTVAVHAALKPALYACDCCRAEARGLNDGRVRCFSIKKLGGFPSLAEFSDFFLRQKVAEKALRLIEVLEQDNRGEKVVRFSGLPGRHREYFTKLKYSWGRKNCQVLPLLREV